MEETLFPQHLNLIPVRVLDDPQGDTHTKQRTWNLTLHIQTTALALPTFMLSIFLETELIYIILISIILL